MPTKVQTNISAPPSIIRMKLSTVGRGGTRKHRMSATVMNATAAIMRGAKSRTDNARTWVWKTRLLRRAVTVAM